MTKSIRRDAMRLFPFPMPWPTFSNYTPEHRYAIVRYLRHIKPVKHAIPDANPNVELPASVAEAFVVRDYGEH